MTMSVQVGDSRRDSLLFAFLSFIHFQVSWDEINAAWGQAGLLLESLIQFTLELYYRQLAKEKEARRRQSGADAAPITRSPSTLRRLSRQVSQSPSLQVSSEEQRRRGSVKIPGHPDELDASSKEVQEPPQQHIADHVTSSTHPSSVSSSDVDAVVKCSAGSASAVNNEVEEPTASLPYNTTTAPQLQNLQNYRILPRGSHTLILRRVSTVGGSVNCIL